MPPGRVTAVMGDDAEFTDRRFACPGCDEAVDVAAESVGQLVRCPYCNSEFFAADGRTHDEVVDDTAAVDDDAPAPDELNSARVRQLAALRLATLRTRSWWLIGLLMSALTALDLLGKAVVYVWEFHAWGVRPTWLAVGGSAAAAVAVAAYRAARALAREAATSSLTEPAAPPDFSTLDDGSNRWRGLERL